MDVAAKTPNWNTLFEIGSAQEGYFTTRQAAEAGYSSQLLIKNIRAGRIIRVYRGIYRLVHFPAGEHDDLVVAWLWSNRAGIVSHQTALSLHGLSDVLPAKLHLTLPQVWRSRRLRVPEGVVLHHADVPSEDRTWFGPVPATSPCRTLNDCARENLAPDLLRQAAQQAIHRGLVNRTELDDVEEALRIFGGLGL